MARFVKKLGTQQMRYQFDIELHEVAMTIPYEVTVQIVWKKDQKRLESKLNPILGKDGQNKISFEGEKMSMISTLYKDKQKGSFTEKTSQLVIKITKGEKARSVGMVNINLASYLEQGVQRLKLPIEKCPDKEATLEFDITSTLINQTSGSETMSMMSGMQGADVMSIDSGPESEFRFQDIDKDTKKEEEKDPNLKFIKKRAHSRGTQGGQGPGGVPKAPPTMMKGGLDPDEIIKSTNLDSIPETISEKQVIKIDKSKLKIIRKPPAEENLEGKIKLKIQSKLEKELKDAQTSQVQNNIQFQKQMDQVIAEKAKLNDQYQKQLQVVLREKEELTINCSSLEDKLQKMDLDREQLKLKYKQLQSDIQRQNQKLSDSENQVTVLQNSQDEMQSQFEQKLEQVKKSKEELEKKFKDDQTLLNDRISLKNQKLQEKDQKIAKILQEIENKTLIEQKLRNEISELNQNQNLQQGQVELKLKEKIESLDFKNDKLMQEISVLKSQITELKSQNEELAKENKSVKFQQDYSKHELNEEQQKTKDLLKEINSINLQIKELELSNKSQISQKETQIRELQSSLETQKVTISSQERRIKDKDKRLSIQETKIIDLQEDLVQKMNEFENENSSQKDMYQHQIDEMRKHIQELQKPQNESQELKQYKYRAQMEIAALEEQNQDLQNQLSQPGTGNIGETQLLKSQISKLSAQLKEVKSIDGGDNALKSQLKQQILRCNDLEDQLVEAKMSWANLDMENDELTMKLNQKNQAIKMFSSQVTKLEIELVGAKQQLGDALNQVQEFEMGVVPFSRGPMRQSKTVVNKKMNMSDDRASEESAEEPTPKKDKLAKMFTKFMKK